MSMSSMYPKAKRLMDIIAGGLGLFVLSPVLLGCAVAVRSSSAGPVLFRQTRMGRGGREFEILKFRSMRVGDIGPMVTGARDPRITAVGRVLRRYKLDELPQLVNVLHGDMSLVGPRPELLRYVEIFPMEYSRILSVRPGLTDFAAIEYRDEEDLLALSADPELAYVEQILPAKIQLYFKYLDHLSLKTDLTLIGKTVRAVIR